MSEKYYDIKGAAEYLGISVSAVKYYIYNLKTLKPQKVGHSFIFTQDQLDQVNATRRPQGRPKTKNSSIS